MANKQPSWWSIVGNAVSSPWLYFLVPAGIVGLIALFSYMRDEGALVPILIALAVSAVLLLFGYLLWRPLVRFGYIFMWLGVWLAVTSLVLRLFAFGPIIGVLGSALWVIASAVAIPSFVLGMNTVTPEQQQELQRQMEQKWDARVIAASKPDARLVYSPQNCMACGANITQSPVVGSTSRKILGRVDGATGRSRQVIEQVVEQRQCACGQQTFADFPDGSHPES